MPYLRTWSGAKHEMLEVTTATFMRYLVMRCYHILLRDNRDVNLPGTRGWYEEENGRAFLDFWFSSALGGL